MVRYRSGDLLVCRSNYQIEKFVTVGNTYEVLQGDTLSTFMNVTDQQDLMVVIKCDDGKERAISKTRFVPATEVIIKRGKLEVLKPARKNSN